MAETYARISCALTALACARTILPLAKVDERAGLLSDFYLEGYLAFSLPAVLTGLLAPFVRLPVAADVYGAAVILMAVASLVAPIPLFAEQPRGPHLVVERDLM